MRDYPMDARYAEREFYQETPKICSLYSSNENTTVDAKRSRYYVGSLSILRVRAFDGSAKTRTTGKTDANSIQDLTW